MATHLPPLDPIDELDALEAVPHRIHSTCDFIQALMKLQRTAQLITSTLDLDVLFDRVVNDIAAAIGCVEVSVWLREAGGDEMVLHGVRGCSTYCKGDRLKIGERGMVGHVAATGVTRYAGDVTTDPYYVACELDTRSEVAVPLLLHGEVIGALCVDHKQINAFSDDQIAVMEALAAHIAVAIENARLFRNERQEREQMQREADDARAVQQSLFVKAVPLVCGFAFETAWNPAGAVAGDWFDLIDLGDHRCGIVLADVSGKGMPAALLMSATRAILRSLVKLDPSPGKTLMQLNQILMEDFPMGKFVTMIYGVLDARSREITIASAGHLPPLLINGECSFLDIGTGMPLGLGTTTYPEYKVTLKPGTQLLFYTDGITEAMNRSDEEYGAARLADHFLQPSACVEGLIEEVCRFSHGSNHTDDATAVLIRSR
ncbi:PP2C family protein-serine/threonine phosphatase [Tunturibacter empetritectus]|uniref:Sigma-B regulation protein RsbU (Phosphoserine phosphatase) n=1 Tax=Tunturiibacter lichenicola TaxID=2051959 RepID=A0A7W8J8G6_9BACT|nr:GAF domain-containing SpoIIE family protein phosphatase [Edaphobacter lichenicola]MBB5344558.1 sigma-B regulation protein RsbU (phosphoserine phosphatase) [Edaphobacter lichenicola]